MTILKDFMREKAAAANRARANKQEPKLPPTPTPAECPLDREQLGRSSWEVLHTIGIYYPDNPSEEYQERMRNFIETLGLLYPCHTCSKSFMPELAKSPPRVESRTSLSLWLCEQHNIVSKKLHKPLFECTMAKLDERWRQGRDECWGDLAEEMRKQPASESSSSCGKK